LYVKHANNQPIFVHVKYSLNLLKERTSRWVGAERFWIYRTLHRERKKVRVYMVRQNKYILARIRHQTFSTDCRRT